MCLSSSLSSVGTTPQPVQRVISPTMATNGANKAHIFVRTYNNKQTTCFLCRKIRDGIDRGVIVAPPEHKNKTLRCRFGCTECNVGFHIDCFAAYHYEDHVRLACPEFATLVNVAKNLKEKRSLIKSKLVPTSLNHLDIKQMQCIEIFDSGSDNENLD